MAVVYVLAHFDDEYCALPLLREAELAGADQWFLYVTDYAAPALSARRLAETRRLLAHLGLPPERALHVGAGVGALDGELHRSMGAAFAALQQAVRQIGPVERFVTTGLEGGHMDHDCCALLTLELARAKGTPVEQFSLYNGRGLPRPLFRSATPIPENGAVRRLKLTAGQLLAWLAAVRFFPSQAKTWAGLAPAMFWSLALRGFGVQRLEPARAHERPHEGVLLYERMFGVPYGEVRAAQDAFLSRAG